MVTFPLNLVVTFALALASYYLIERPALRLRARIEVAWESGRAKAQAIPAEPARLGLG